ncbi:MAG: hypothetical protein PHH98_03615 [Candidatus Gracilibacteria bacterium]|nr:hypothetical protein [Candidatus Gracilibacteria bacterium]
MFFHSPDFLIFSTILFFLILFLILKVIDVLNNRKKRKSLENIVNFFVEEGDFAMKNIFQKAISQVDAAHAAKPISGNEEELSAIFSKVYERSQQQGFGLAQLMSAASFVKAANAQQGEINEIIEAVKAELASASCRFDADTKQFLQNALAKGPEEFVKVLQQATTQVEVSQAEVPAPAVVEEPPLADNIVQLVAASVEHSSVNNEDELKHILSSCTWLPVKLPDEPYSIMGLPASTFDRLWGQLNVRLHKTHEENRAFELLDQIKLVRDGESAKKIGGIIRFLKKAAKNMQLFFFFQIYMLLLF